MPPMPTSTEKQALSAIDTKLKKEFDSNQRVLTFEEYLSLLRKDPNLQLRSSAQYVVDMMDHFGKKELDTRHSTGFQLHRFNLFDFPVDGIAPKLVGQEAVQTQIYKTLKSFIRQGLNNRLILLHGPNGSAKTTAIHSVMNGMERYSHEKEGAAYTFVWIFPNEALAKGSLGIQSYAKKDTTASYAKLTDIEIGARITCELKDHPFMLIPASERLSFLKELLGEAQAIEIFDSLPSHFKEGGICHRCQLIYDALLNSHDGDYSKVLQHIQVERFFFSRRYRKGLATVEPQLHVDAEYQQLTLNKNFSNIPPALQGLNIFKLTGHLVDGARGIVEFSDLLKRPVDTFKYLLGACETGAVNVGSSIAYVDSVMLGSTNELQLDAFKEFPDYGSFKARIELIRVPYLLSLTKEQEIYKLILEKDKPDKHCAPHVSWTLALWTILTRLKKPNSINYPPSVSSLISNLSPLDKVRLYDNGEIPVSLTAEDRKLLKSNISVLSKEYNSIPYYEGRLGASVREAKTILFDALHNPKYPCLSPLAVLVQIEEFVKNVSDYEFLKQDVKDGYHDTAEFLKIVYQEYLNKVDREVRDSMGLYEADQWEEFIKKYILHTSTLLKKEKIQNPVTGKSENPDQTLIDEFEKIIEAPKEKSEIQKFRNNMISQVGAWSLDHRNEKLRYSEVFPQYWSKLEKHFYESQKGLLKQVSNALKVYDSDKEDPNSEARKLARQTLKNMQKNQDYCEKCAKEVIMFLMNKRY